ncbi:MAG: magnesium chelatase [Treponema sp.]|nr:MAG: magnesium chelatase [Treponema sp.]
MITGEIAKKLIENLERVIKGKTEVLRLFVTAFLSGGHVLIEDVPGTGKTTLVKTLAASIQADDNVAKFQRIQCTPDLLPYDITGVEVFNMASQTFDFVKGPVFCDVLLADELNRTPPKVQSALLEVMAEKQVTFGKKTYPLSDLFFVAATQNPVESLGVYPLPAAQLDRFMFLLSIGYPEFEAELEILQTDPSEAVLPEISTVVSIAEINQCKKEQANVFVHPALQKAIIEICNITRKHPGIELGASPRAGLQLLKASKTLALIEGRTWVEDIDIKALSSHLFAHRLILNDRNIDGKKLVDEIVLDALNKMDRVEKWEKPDFQKTSENPSIS